MDPTNDDRWLGTVINEGTNYFIVADDGTRTVLHYTPQLNHYLNQLVVIYGKLHEGQVFVDRIEVA